ncbi:RluA family pseudouridine synthase [Acidocella sp.]|uniref:RluA family pseudouridine synthase n=1 Tax=Acidocella sp. TaxID=50710 RepID=UPI00260F9792|nr:RNA pseudouridine synthase [Acidocella sp.]
MSGAPEILWRARGALVIDKPAGLAVHAGRAGGPSVEDFFPLWRAGRNGPWLAHRLDTDTAGCLVVALKKTALLEIQAAFAAHGVHKTYWAVVQGAPVQAEGVIDAPLLKATQGRAWKMAVSPAGQGAVTQWRVLAAGQGRALVAFYPRTGRTHQIRAHAAHIGHPIMGDAVYGGGPGALQLLARAIRLEALGGVIAAEAPVPAHMRAAVEACGGAL